MIRSTAVVALGVFALAAGSASAAAPKKNTITAVGGMKVKANAHVQDAQRWDASRNDVKSGDTVTLRDRSTEGQPHTLSLVKKLPKTPAQIMGCAACGPLMAAHEANMETGQVGKPVVEAGADGFGGDKTAAAGGPDGCRGSWLGPSRRRTTSWVGKGVRALPAVAGAVCRRGAGLPGSPRRLGTPVKLRATEKLGSGPAAPMTSTPPARARAIIASAGGGKARSRPAKAILTTPRQSRAIPREHERFAAASTDSLTSTAPRRLRTRGRSLSSARPNPHRASPLPVP